MQDLIRQAGDAGQRAAMIEIADDGDDPRGAQRSATLGGAQESEYACATGQQPGGAQADIAAADDEDP